MYIDDLFESPGEDKIAGIKRKLRLLVDNDIKLVKLLLKNNNYELNYIELAKPEELVDMLFDVIKSNNNIMEDLRQWFKEKWVRFGPDGKIRGECARGDDSEGKPKCLPQAKAHALGKKGRKQAASRKRREDPNPERSGPAINVKTKESLAVIEGTETQYIAARYIDEFADGDHWYVKGTPDVIKKFVLLANSLEDESVKGTEYEPNKGMMAKVHAQLGDDSVPQWTVIKAQNLKQLKPIGNRVLQLLMKPDLSYGAQEFMSEFLWTLEEKGLALVTGEPQQGVAESPVQWHNTETGGKDAAQTDHTMDEALEYLKTNYPIVKMYNVSRATMGLTALDQPKYVNTGDEADINKNIIRKSAAHMSGVDSAVDYLQLRKNAMMSGSQQVTLTIGYSWSVYENPNNGIAMLYYQDRGMAWDEIYLAGKTPKIQAQARQVFRDAGVLPTPMKKTKQQGVAESELNEFAPDESDDWEDPFDNYPCYDCGSTIFLHHTKLCDLAEDNAIRDLPADPGSQHWTGEIPKGLIPIPGLTEGTLNEFAPNDSDNDDNSIPPNRRVTELAKEWLQSQKDWDAMQWIENTLEHYGYKIRLHRSSNTRELYVVVRHKDKKWDDTSDLSDLHFWTIDELKTMLNEKKDSCYYKVKSRYKVWPSAYASGALAKCRKKGVKNWGNKSESVQENKIYFTIPKSLENEQELTESFKFNKDSKGWYLKEGQENFKQNYSNALKAFTILK